MDTKALERFCPWARRELVDAVRRGMEQLAVNEEGREKWPAGSETAGGRALSPEERGERDAAIARIQKAGGDAAFAEQEAYGCFNRLMALRYMEVNDLLPWGGRALSTAEDAFEPPLAVRADALGLSFLDTASWAERASAGDDEGAFRLALVAACRELEPALPGVFGGAATALLPAGLLSRGEHGVINALVRDVPQEIWGSVEALGWAYQFYNSERKDEFFKSKRKASREDVAPATQLFTPDWIVRYMVQNTLGRLWMLNNPQSPLQNQMEFYIEPEAEHEDFLRINGPEEITFCDPACGSGHILVYAFDLLAEMYRERGWRERDIPRAILQNNLSGYEIDSRAAQIAQTALCMKCLELDRRWLSRAVAADVRVLEPVELPASAIPGREALADALAHLTECGSLLAPTSDDIAALESAVEATEGSDLMGATRAAALDEALSTCRALSRRFDVVVANPPYMGSSGFGPWTAKWIKKTYPDSCRDLCTAFIERGYTLATERGYASMVTMQSWMFLGSFEKMRGRMIERTGIVSMVHIGPRAFDAIGGEVVNVTAAALYNAPLAGEGSYVRLVDIAGSEPKRSALLEAIQNPGCGWFYRADASTFRDIPGSPIAYWVGKGLLDAFKRGSSIAVVSDYTGSPNITGDNDKYLRYHWECTERACTSGGKWVPYSKGGNFRKWYGNVVHVADWTESARAFYRDNKTSTLLPERYWFKGGITYTMLTSGMPCFRHFQDGGIFDKSGPVICGLGAEEPTWLAFLNSSIAAYALGLLNPTMNLQVRDVKALPALNFERDKNRIDELARQSISLSHTDWDAQETSWDFKRSPLV